MKNGKEELDEEVVLAFREGDEICLSSFFSIRV